MSFAFPAFHEARLPGMLGATAVEAAVTVTTTAALAATVAMAVPATWPLKGDEGGTNDAQLDSTR